MEKNLFLIKLFDVKQRTDENEKDTKSDRSQEM